MKCALTYLKDKTDIHVFYLKAIFFINNLLEHIHLKIDHNFCLVHEEITSIWLYTPCNPLFVGYARVCTT